MHVRRRHLIVPALLTVVLVGCGGATPSAPSTPPATDPAVTPSGSVAPSATSPSRAPASATASPVPSASATGEGTTEVTIGTPPSSETIYRPDSATVASGDLVRLFFVNSSTTPHNVTFDAPIDAATDPYVQPGETGEVTFTAPAPGDYEFYCTLHPWMTGTLTVTP